MADQQNAAKDDISEDELDQIIQDMSKDEAEPEPEKPALEVVQSKKKTVAPVASAPVASATNTSSAQALTLELNGVVNLKLRFQNGERSIEVSCAEDFLTCKMADGTEFRIPTGATSKVRKAA